MLTQTEENYLKTIFALAEKSDGRVSTNTIAASMQTAAASVTDMVKRLGKRGWVEYVPYKGTRLTPKGDRTARNLIRRHRIWETFLYDRLHFNWDEVHDLAEQLEHIRSDELVNRLEALLGFPCFDPHGDPIPDRNGQFAERNEIPLSDWTADGAATIVGVREHSKTFLCYLAERGLRIGTTIRITERFSFDQSLSVLVNGERQQTITSKVAHNLFVNNR